MEKNVIMKLTYAEMYVAAQVGVMRRIASMQNGNNKNVHAYKSDWATDANGAGAEMAVAKFYGVYWEPTVNSFHTRPDISNGYDVRSTCHVEGHLILRRNDADDRVYILVICDAPTFRLVGGVTGRIGKIDDFLKPGSQFGGADHWMIPQDWIPGMPEVRARIIHA